MRSYQRWDVLKCYFASPLAASVMLYGAGRITWCGHCTQRGEKVTFLHLCNAVIAILTYMRGLSDVVCITVAECCDQSLGSVVCYATECVLCGVLTLLLLCSSGSAKTYC